MNVLKKAPPERIKEILRILNWLASPFGSEEALMLAYGLKDQDYTLDEQGNPRPTHRGRGARWLRAVALSVPAPVGHLSGGSAGLCQGVATKLKRRRSRWASTIRPTATTPRRSTRRATWPTSPSTTACAQSCSANGRSATTTALVKEWQTAAGDQIRKEYTDAIAAAR